MVEASGLTATLLKAQKADGGWGYESAVSWTEPTAFALLALSAIEARGFAYEQGCRWLLAQQRPDGGWPPNPQVALSNAATSNALLALGEFAPQAAFDRGISWLLAQVCPELTMWERIQYWWQERSESETLMGGAPWFPGTASWVSPTVMMILSLAQAQVLHRRSELVVPIAKAKAYLLSRRCKSGGWNHGGSFLYSEEASAYPEMTGMALLAFDPSDRAVLSQDLRLAQEMFHSPQSGEGQSWLQLALAKHGYPLAPASADRFPCRTVSDLSLRILAQQTKAGCNKLLIQTS